MNEDRLAREVEQRLKELPEAELERVVGDKAALENGECPFTVSGSEGETENGSDMRSNGGSSRRKSQADIIIDLATQAEARFFHTPVKEPFVSFPVDEHIETWPVKSKASRRWFTRLFYVATEKAPNREAMQSALNLFEAKAVYDGQQDEVHLRTAWRDGSLYYDLADSAWRCVEVTTEGWRVLPQAPVKFRRFAHMAPQAEPVCGGSLDSLWQFLNVSDEKDRELIQALLVIGVVPNIPRPALVLHGDQGSAKSTTAKFLRALVDPSSHSLIRARDEAEYIQGLAHHFCAIFDNLSVLPDWLSDLLSRAVTGEGFTKRELYTNDDDIMFSYRRLLILTGIGLVVTKPDLLDRSIIIGLKQVPDNQRKEEIELEALFEAERPRLFGTILDRLSTAIRNYPATDLGSLPRMADFSRWAVAAGGGERFIEAYTRNVERQNTEAIAASPVATVLLAFLENRQDWDGTATDLLAALTDKAEAMRVSTRERYWPKAGNALSRRLQQVRPNLLALGWRIDIPEDERPRRVVITRNNTRNIVGTDRTDGRSDDTDGSDDISATVTGREDWEEIEL